MINEDPLLRELQALDALGDDDIDTSDIPVRTDFSSAVRRRFLHLTAREYDVRAIANWCILRAREQSRTVSNLWLNKMVYFIYEEALRINKIILTQAKAEAWNHGPVFREIYFGIKSENAEELLKTFDPIQKRRVVAEEDFSPSDIAIFEGVWRRLGHRTATQLRKLSHEEGQAWHTVWNYSGNSNPGMRIDIGTIIGVSDLRANGNG